MPHLKIPHAEVVCKGHRDVVSGCQLSPDGTFPELFEVHSRSILTSSPFYHIIPYYTDTLDILDPSWIGDDSVMHFSTREFGNCGGCEVVFAA